VKRRSRRGSSGEEEEVPKRKKFRRGRSSEEEEVAKRKRLRRGRGCEEEELVKRKGFRRGRSPEGCEGEEKRRGGMRTENSKHQNPTSPELEALHLLGTSENNHPWLYQDKGDSAWDFG
jgi:hypothetical protein